MRGSRHQRRHQRRTKMALRRCTLRRWQMLVRPPRFCSRVEPTSTPRPRRWGYAAALCGVGKCLRNRRGFAQEWSRHQREGRRWGLRRCTLRHALTAEVLLQNGADIGKWLAAAMRRGKMRETAEVCSRVEPTSTRRPKMALRRCTLRRRQMLVRPPRFCSKVKPTSTRRPQRWCYAAALCGVGKCACDSRSFAQEWSRHQRQGRKWTLLHAAALCGVGTKCYAAVCAAWANAEVLLKSGADINAKAENGLTPLHDAASANAGATSEVLLQNGAAVNAKVENGTTPLHLAALANAYETAEVLLKWEADVNAEDSTGFLGGEKPLYYAMKEEASETAELLVRHGGQR